MEKLEQHCLFLYLDKSSAPSVSAGVSQRFPSGVSPWFGDSLLDTPHPYLNWLVRSNFADVKYRACNHRSTAHPLIAHTMQHSLFGILVHQAILIPFGGHRQGGGAYPNCIWAYEWVVRTLAKEYNNSVLVIIKFMKSWRMICNT